jgi:type IV pilus secretin PilQ/predicted competence protein
VADGRFRLATLMSVLTLWTSGGWAQQQQPPIGSSISLPQTNTGQQQSQAGTNAPSQEKVQPVKSPNGIADVSGVSITSGPEGELFVDVKTSQPTTYHVLQLSNPRRLVLDVDQARQAFHQKTFAAQSPLLSEVRVGQFKEKNPSVVRVVADLTGDPIFDVHSQAGGIRIALKARTSAAHVTKAGVSTTATATPVVKEEKPTPVVAETQTPRTDTVATTKAREEVPSEHVVAQDIMAKLGSAVTNHSEFQSVLPPASGSNEVSASPSSSAPDQSAEAVQASNAAKVLANSTETKVDDAQGQSPGTASLQAEPTHFTGEPISLNLKDVDVKDFIRLIHEISGLNILVDPDVTGSITMVLDNVPWDQALDIVLKNNQLGKTLEGNVLRISRVATLTAQQEAASKLVQAKEDAQPLVTRFVTLNYANAKSVQALFKAWVGGGALSKRGNMVVDDRTNTLIISDIATQIPVLIDILNKLDTKSKQISIEARVVLASKTFERDLSGALNNGWVNKSTSTVTGGATGVGSQVTGVIPSAAAAKAARIVIGQTSTAGFGSYAISNEGARYFINAMIAASEITSDAKTISKPMIVTQNNVAGTVVQGVQIPIQTNINNTITVSYINAALTLNVTPQVTGDGNVFLIIKVENSSPGNLVTGAGISINTQSATTQVLVPDGGTVIFGGVTINGNAANATYVPWLGQIPILGHLFKTSVRSSNDSELIFFVSPKVLPG